jgi:hypothetical protein
MTLKEMLLLLQRRTAAHDNETVGPLAQTTPS